LESAARERRRWEAEENEWKAALLVLGRLQPAGLKEFTYTTPGMTASIRRRSTVTLGPVGVVKDVLGDRYEKVLLPDKSRVFEMCSKDPSLMARALAMGALGVAATEYVATELKEPEEIQAVPADRQGSAERPAQPDKIQ
jgi:hypothetical protein